MSEIKKTYREGKNFVAINFFEKTKATKGWFSSDYNNTNPQNQDLVLNSITVTDKQNANEGLSFSTPLVLASAGSSDEYVSDTITQTVLDAFFNKFGFKLGEIDSFKIQISPKLRFITTHVPVVKIITLWIKGGSRGSYNSPLRLSYSTTEGFGTYQDLPPTLVFKNTKQTNAYVVDYDREGKASIVKKENGEVVTPTPTKYKLGFYSTPPLVPKDYTELLKDIKNSLPKEPSLDKEETLAGVVVKDAPNGNILPAYGVKLITEDMGGFINQNTQAFVLATGENYYLQGTEVIETASGKDELVYSEKLPGCVNGDNYHYWTETTIKSDMTSTLITKYQNLGDGINAVVDVKPVGFKTGICEIRRDTMSKILEEGFIYHMPANTITFYDVSTLNADAEITINGVPFENFESKSSAMSERLITNSTRIRVTKLNGDEVTLYFEGDVRKLAKNSI